MPKAPFRFVAMGECMVELQTRPDGTITQTFGGDTFNTAAYVARLGRDHGVAVDYVTAIGDDPFSDEMAAFWRANGVGDGHVLRRPGRRPGLYAIRTDAKGERRFFYWRGEAAVRECFETEGSDEMLEALGGFDMVYVSGISLAVLKPASRERLLARLETLAAAGTAVAFDCNWRPILWGSLEEARAVYERVIAVARYVLMTIEELAVLGLDQTHEAAILRFGVAGAPEVVVKDGAAPCLVVRGVVSELVPGVPDVAVVDTTAAGDSFSAAWLLGRALGLEPAEAARRAHVVAAAVVRHRGAIIPEAETPRVFADLA